MLRASVVAAAVTWGAAAACAQETVKIGFIGPLSGSNAQQGLSARNGFQLAIDQANKAGLPFEEPRPSSSTTPPIRRPASPRP